MLLGISQLRSIDGSVWAFYCSGWSRMANINNVLPLYSHYPNKLRRRICSQKNTLISIFLRSKMLTINGHRQVRAKSHPIRILMSSCTWSRDPVGYWLFYNYISILNHRIKYERMREIKRRNITIKFIFIYWTFCLFWKIYVKLTKRPKS